MEQVQGYGYFERFYINFSSAPNNEDASDDYRVTFKQRLFAPTAIENPPTPIELDGGPSPFILSLSNVEDVFTPMRAAVARISFVDDIDLGELLPMDAFEWRVELTRLTDDKRIFVGYLTAEVYSQPSISGPNIVTVNAASPMTPISALPMPIANVGSLTIGGLIQMAIKSTIEQDIDTVYIPAIYSLKNNAAVSDYAELLGWNFSTAPYIKSTEQAADGSIYEYSPYRDALDVVCRLFGWSMVDPGDGGLYFVSPAYQGPYMQLSSSDLTAESPTPLLITPGVWDSASILPIDTGDTIEHRQGYGRITITAVAEKLSLDMPSLESSVKEQRFSRKTSEAQESAGDGIRFTTYKAECATIEAIVDNPRVSIPKYYVTLDSSGSPVWNHIPAEEEALARQGSVGAFYRKIDWCNPADLDLENSENPKRGWNLEPVIMVRDAGSYGLGGKVYDIRLPDNQPIISMNLGCQLVPRGAIRIDFAIAASTIDGFYMVSDDTYSGGDIEDKAHNLTSNMVGFIAPWWGESKDIRASVRIGNRYYDGVSWTEAFSVINIPISTKEAEWHQVDSNKTVDMPYEGDSGYYIPIDTPMQGDVEFCIYPSFYPYVGPSPNIGLVPNAYIKGLEVSFANLVEHRILHAGDAVYQRVLKDGFSEQVDLSLRLHSKIDASEYSTLLYDLETSPIDKVYRTTSTTAEKPERFLLDEYERVYGRTIRRWRRGMWLRSLSPIDLFTSPGSEDSALMLSGYTMDFGENTSEMYVTEVRIVKKVKYVD